MAEKSKKSKIDLKKTALIIVDMQNDFCHEEGYSVKVLGDISGTIAAIPKIKTLADKCRQSGIPVFNVYVSLLPDYSDTAFPMDKLPSGAAWPSMCVEGTFGVQIVDELKPQENDYMICKKSYGAFFHTLLDLILRNKGVKTLIMADVATNVCIETTAREARDLGYNIIFSSDTTGTFTEEMHKATLETINMFSGK